MVKINGVSYDAEALSDEVKAHLQRLAFIDAEQERLHLQLDVLNVARQEIGARLDRAMLHMELNQPKPAHADGTGAAA